MSGRHGSLGERLLRYVAIEGDHWIWTGARNGDGYGRIWGGKDLGRPITAQHASHLAFKGPIPDGMEIDHLCRAPLCINPDHLEAVTHRENVIRGQSPSAVAHRAGTCTQGHPRSEAVLRRGTSEIVYCKTCRRERRAAA